MVAKALHRLLFRKTYGKIDPIESEKGIRMKEKVIEALDKVRPSLQADGGDVELIDITDDGVVQVRLQGACAGCPMSQMTLKNGIERYLKQNVPEVKSVENV